MPNPTKNPVCFYGRKFFKKPQKLFDTNQNLRKIKDKIGGVKKDAYYYIISKLLIYENEDFSNEIYDFYLRDAAQGIYQVSPVTRTKCVSILSYLSRIHLQPILSLFPFLLKMCRDDFWELQGQLLILCSNALLFFNTQPEGQELREIEEEDKIIETSNEQSRL